jgi:hypothetical protein
MGDLAQSVGSVVAKVKRSERAAASRIAYVCPKTRQDETCDGRLHYSVIDDGDSRPCPLDRYRAVRAELADALELAGYIKGRNPLADPVHQVLLAKWSESNQGGLKADYPGPGEAQHRAHELAGMGFGSGYHLLMHGGKGKWVERVGGKNLESVAVVAIQPVRRADPDKALFILLDGTHPVVRKALPVGERFQ